MINKNKMPKQRMIKDSFWSDPYIQELNPTDKLIFLYLLTNPNVNVSGIYEITERQMVFDIGVDKNRLGQALDRLGQDGKILYKNNWIIIINFIKNQSTNPSIQKGIERVIKTLPDWIQDSLPPDCTQAGTYSTLLNLTLPNLTQPENLVVSKTDYTDLEDLIKRRNGVVLKNKQKIQDFKTNLPKTIKITKDLKETRKTIRKEFGFDEIRLGINNYIEDIENRKYNEDGYYNHRFTFYEFLTRKGGLQKFINN